jgi:predicted porin
VIYGDAYSNYVSYITPTISGFTAAIALVPVDGNTTATKDAMSYTVQYANGPLAAAYNLTDSRQTSAGQYITQGTNSGTATGTADLGYIAAVGAYKMTTLLASYDLGVAKFGVTRQSINLATGVNPGAGTSFTVNVPMGQGSIGAGYGNRTNTAVSDLQFGDGVKQSFIGYRYDLSKRTNVQAVYAKIDRQGTSKDITMNHVLLGHSF